MKTTLSQCQERVRQLPEPEKSVPKRSPWCCRLSGVVNFAKDSQNHSPDQQGICIALANSRHFLLVRSQPEPRPQRDAGAVHI
eukprot:15441945-Heterocapsa_arctica.AAC.1